MLRPFALLFVTLALGLWVGNKIFRRLNQQKLRIMVYGYLIVSGFLMLFR